MAHIARKRFGQNFLHDNAIIQDIIGSLQARSSQHWVEIGPGQGALTTPLLQQVKQLDVIELDRDLVALLKVKFNDAHNLNIHAADALRFDFASLASADEKLRIVGNLPYNISTPLLFHLLVQASSIEDMYFMLQKEVVDRICAPPGSKKYGRLSVMMSYYCAAEHLFDVPPESFDPVPQVMSAIIRLIPHRILPIQANDLTVFNQLVAQAFSQRRKTLRNSLKTMVSEAEIAALGIDASLRAENISLESFVKLSNFYTDKANKSS